MTISEKLKKALKEDPRPHRVALSFAVGTAISFSPFLGLHLLLAVVISFLFRLNKVETILGTFVNNPWSVPFVYGGAYFLGAWMLGRDLPPFSLDLMVRPEFIVPLLLGCLVFMAAGGALAYLAAWGVMRRLRRPVPAPEENPLLPPPC
jgi:uncharacterized protein (DUF2062 family)